MPPAADPAFAPSPTAESVPNFRPRRSSPIIWGSVAALAVIAFVFLHYVPMTRELSELKTLHEATTKSLKDAQRSAIENRELYDKAEAERGKLANKLDAEVKAKDDALKALADAQTQLSTDLGDHIADGELLVVRRNGKLVVDVSDKILFPLGEAEITERGQKVLTQVADTLSRIEGFIFEVAGHTDSANITSPKTLEKFPTNWELSTARATNVVRFLEDSGKVKGKQLVAMGFAQHRPVASNTSKYNMARNRRIEITLAPIESTK